NLNGANLAVSSAENADFSRARMIEVNLSGAKLNGAKFRSAKLRNAIMIGAKVEGTDFTGADLSGDNLRNVDLSSATMTNARLEGAILKKDGGAIPSLIQFLIDQHSIWIATNGMAGER